MISKLPRWIELGAFILAFVAGCINAIGLLGFEHQSVSHVSGTATLLGTSLLNQPAMTSLHLGAVLFAFFIGAGLSGLMLHGATLKLGRHYEAALMLEALLIFLALFLLTKGSFYGHLAASAACGLQNALATTYSGAIIRTTHLTGIFTDLGIMLGGVLRGDDLDRRKLVLFLLIIVGFIAGGSLGALLFGYVQFAALIFPGVVCLLLAFSYRLYAYRHLD